MSSLHTHIAHEGQPRQTAQSYAANSTPGIFGIGGRLAPRIARDFRRLTPREKALIAFALLGS
jgi:hypothetical protein